MDRFCCDKKNVELLGRYECIIPTQKKYYKKKKTYKNYDKRNYKRQKFRFKNIIIINTRKIITQILEENILERKEPYKEKRNTKKINKNIIQKKWIVDVGSTMKEDIMQMNALQEQKANIKRKSKC